MKMRRESTIIMLSLTAIFLSSCNMSGNTSTRPVAKGNQSQQTNYFNQPSSNNQNSFASDTAASATSKVPDDVKHCSWGGSGNTGYSHAATHLSPNEDRSVAFTVCQSSQNENIIRFQVESPIVDAQLCFIPMNQNGNQKTYIGEPRCLTADTKDKIYQINMYKTRSGFESLKLNGIMVMKDKNYTFPHPFTYYQQPMKSPDAFLICNQQLVYNYDSSYCNAYISQQRYIYRPVYGAN